LRNSCFQWLELFGKYFPNLGKTDASKRLIDAAGAQLAAGGFEIGPF
jgi:hypothetical protein